MHHASCIMHHASCIMHHASCIMHHASCIMHHASCIMHHASCIMHHASCIMHDHLGVPKEEIQFITKPECRYSIFPYYFRSGGVTILLFCRLNMATKIGIFFLLLGISQGKENKKIFSVNLREMKPRLHNRMVLLSPDSLFFYFPTSPHLALRSRVSRFA